MTRSHFSESYQEARDRFRDAAAATGATLQSYPVDVGSPGRLSIDAASFGPVGAPALLLTSGLHGVEGFFGSAIQLAFLEQLARAEARPNIRYVLVHALNPFGFSQVRRVDEFNVDLNRNYRLPFGTFEGEPPAYAHLDSLLNPPSPPSRLDAFRLKILSQIVRRGTGALREAVAGGQYEHPRGLFFGGKAPSPPTLIVQGNCDSWLGSSQTILHLDFHSGLGRFADCKMLISDPSDANQRWFAGAFGAATVQRFDRAGIAYKASGPLVEWMRMHFSGRDYRGACPEFGTYGGIRVLRALRAENRAHHYCEAGDPRLDRAKKELFECFCPSKSSWRNRIIESGLQIIAQGERGLMKLADRDGPTR